MNEAVVNALKEKYPEVYESARKKVLAQFGIFDDDETDKSITRSTI